MRDPNVQKVTIVMPVYNRKKTIYKAIQSVLTQTYSHFELIIVDDASDDETGQIIQSIDDQRIKYIKHKKRLGASAARNTGVEHAEHRLIAFQDSDDYWSPEKLEKQLKLYLDLEGRFKNPPIIYTAFSRYRNGNCEYIPSKKMRRKQGFIHEQLLNGNFISTQTVLLSKASFNEVGGFSEEMPRFQDWELWIRLSLTHQFYLIDEPLVEVYYSEDSISSSQEKIVKAYEKIIAKHHCLYKKASNKHLSRLYFSYGHNLCLLGKLKKGRMWLFKSYSENKISIKSLLAYGISLLGKNLYCLFYQVYK